VQEIYDVNIYETIQENIYLCRIAWDVCCFTTVDFYA
jgi:hypothetical protein